MKNKIMKNQKKKKSWWKEHWDEVILILGTILGLYLILKANGVVR